MSEIDFTSHSQGFHHTAKTDKSYIPKDLESCEYVFVRIDRVRKPLEAPYQGPFLVKNKNSKIFQILLPNGKTENISIDRVKPAYVSKNLPTQKVTPTSTYLTVTPNVSIPTPEVQWQRKKPQQSERPQPAKRTKLLTTRTGRRVHFPTKLASYAT